MRTLIYQVAVGPMRPLWQRCIESVQKYAARIGADYQCQSEIILGIKPDPAKSGRSPQATARLGCLPIYEKQNALSYLSEYDAVAVIDSDIFITLLAPNIFATVPEGADFAGVCERDLPISDAYARKLDKYEKGQYDRLDGVGLPFLQGGVQVWQKPIVRLCGTDPRAFLARPEFARFINGEGDWKWSTDQTLMSWWLRSSGANVYHLDPCFNWLYGMVREGRERDGWFHHFLLSKYIVGEDPLTLIQTAGRTKL